MIAVELVLLIAMTALSTINLVFMRRIRGAIRSLQRTDRYSQEQAAADEAAVLDLLSGREWNPRLGSPPVLVLLFSELFHRLGELSDRFGDSFDGSVVGVAASELGFPCCRAGMVDGLAVPHESSPYVADAERAGSVDPANIVGGATDTSPCVGAAGVREHAAPADTSSRSATVFSEGGSWASQGFDAADLISSALIVLDKEMNRRWALGEQVLSTLGPRLQRIKALGENYQRVGESQPADVEFVVDVLAALLGALDADSTLLKNLSDLLRRSLHHCSPVPSGPGATNTGDTRDLTVPEAADFPVVGPRRGST